MGESVAPLTLIRSKPRPGDNGENDENRENDANSERRKAYFCNEPWIGVLDITTNHDVRFCMCYLKLRLGNLRDATLLELWNAEPLVEIRQAFARGELPDVCRGQLCGPALGAENWLTEVPKPIP